MNSRLEMIRTARGGGGGGVFIFIFWWPVASEWPVGGEGKSGISAKLVARMKERKKNARCLYFVLNEGQGEQQAGVGMYWPD